VEGGSCTPRIGGAGGSPSPLDGGCGTLPHPDGLACVAVGDGQPPSRLWIHAGRTRRWRVPSGRLWIAAVAVPGMDVNELQLYSGTGGCRPRYGDGFGG